MYDDTMTDPATRLQIHARSYPSKTEEESEPK